MDFMNSGEELFVTQICFSQQVLENNFSMGCIIGKNWRIDFDFFNWFLFISIKEPKFKDFMGV